MTVAVPWNPKAFERLQPKLGTWAEIAAAVGCTEVAVRNWAVKPEGPRAKFFSALCSLAKVKLGWTYERTHAELFK